MILGYFGTGFENTGLYTFVGFLAMVVSIVVVTALVMLCFVRIGGLGRQPAAKRSGRRPHSPATAPGTRGGPAAE